jgi:hypothetical protein
MIVTMPVIVEMVTVGNSSYHLHVQSLIFLNLFQLILYNNINLVNSMLTQICKWIYWHRCNANIKMYNPVQSTCNFWMQCSLIQEILKNRNHLGDLGLGGILLKCEIWGMHGSDYEKQVYPFLMLCSLVEVQQRFGGTCCLLGIFFDLGDGDSTVLWIVSKFVPDYTTSHPRR